VTAPDDPAAAAAAELVEVVAPDGTVEAVVDRATMRRDRLRHRCTYVAVVDHRDRLVVHQRAPWKDVWPSRWDVAFGGVVGVGEDWDDAARRELAEEAGLAVPLERIGGGVYDDADVSVLGAVYLARHDGEISFPDGEVVASDRVPLDELDAWLAGHATCPDSVAFVVPAVGPLRGGGA
jgi:8-oxo-dGTP pyrophosphatase MutT (NUDIX family)